MSKIILYLMFFLIFSCSSKSKEKPTEKITSKVMLEFYKQSSKDWLYLKELYYKNPNFADGYSFLSVIKIKNMSQFNTQNAKMPESLLNDPEEHFKSAVFKKIEGVDSFVNSKCEFYSHSVQLTKNDSCSSLYICLNIDDSTALFYYSE